MKLLVSACLLGVLRRPARPAKTHVGVLPAGKAYDDPILPGDLWWAVHTPAGI